MMKHSSMHAIAARMLIVVASMWTAALQLFSPSSLAYRAAGDGQIIDAINVLVLCVAAVAAADLVWHDLLQRGLILPRLHSRRRHHVCVWVYSALAAAFGVRAFVASGDAATATQVGLYYVLIAAGIALEAVALASEKRE